MAPKKRTLFVTALIASTALTAQRPQSSTSPSQPGCTEAKQSTIEKHAKLPPKLHRPWEKLRAKIYEQTGQDINDLKPDSKPKPCPAQPVPVAVKQ